MSTFHIGALVLGAPIVFISVSSDAQTSSLNQVVAPNPGSIRVGHLLVAVQARNASGLGQLTWPAGFAQIHDDFDNQSGFDIGYATKVAVTNDANGTNTYGMSQGAACGAVLVYQRATFDGPITGGTPPHGYASQLASGFNTTATVPSVLPYQAGDVWISMILGNQGTETFTVPAGLTRRAHVAASGFFTVDVFDAGPLPVTATGTATSTSSINTRTSCQSLLIRNVP